MNLKQTLKKVLLNTGTMRFRRSFTAKSLAILFYHSVSDRRAEQASYIPQGITTEPNLFRQHMRLLRKEYNPITLNDACNWLNEKQDIPPNSVIVTFDDGFEDNAVLAAPIMEDVGIYGTFYLTANCIEQQTLPWFCKIRYLFQTGKKKEIEIVDPATKCKWRLAQPKECRSAWLHLAYPCAKLLCEEQESWIRYLESMFNTQYDSQYAPKMMSWEQANEMARRGHLIGNHTFSHPNVAFQTAENQRSEITWAHELLANRLDTPLEHFSYPHPCLNPQWDIYSQTFIREKGYKTIVTTEFGSVKQTDSPFLLKRIPIDNTDLDTLRWKLENAFAGITV